MSTLLIAIYASWVALDGGTPEIGRGNEEMRARRDVDGMEESKEFTGSSFDSFSIKGQRRCVGSFAASGPRLYPR